VAHTVWALWRVGGVDGKSWFKSRLPQYPQTGVLLTPKISLSLDFFCLSLLSSSSWSFNFVSDSMKPRAWSDLSCTFTWRGLELRDFVQAIRPCRPSTPQASQGRGWLRDIAVGFLVDNLTFGCG
jgi:hypothetical protein